MLGDSSEFLPSKVLPYSLTLTERTTYKTEWYYNLLNNGNMNLSLCVSAVLCFEGGVNLVSFSFTAELATKSKVETEPNIQKLWAVKPASGTSGKGLKSSAELEMWIW